MERPTFYAVIPASVRYAPISAMAKLLYGEITALCEKEGYCWAGNGYFAKLYEAGERSVRRWLEELVSAEFIEIDAASNQHGQRRIFIVRPNLPGQKWPAKNDHHNDTRIENGTREIIPSVSPQPTKASKRGRAPAISLDEFLQNSGGEPPTSFGDYARGLGWDAERAGHVWQKFCRYWRSPDARGGGRKRDWFGTWENWCDREAENGRGGRGSGGTAGGGLAAAARASFLSRSGASQPDGGLSGRDATGTSDADGSGAGAGLKPGEIPF